MGAIIPTTSRSRPGPPGEHSLPSAADGMDACGGPRVSAYDPRMRRFGGFSCLVVLALGAGCSGPTPAADVGATDAATRDAPGADGGAPVDAPAAGACELAPAGDVGCTGASPTWTTSVDYASVADCVARASAGDTIRIRPGSATWSETLLLDRPLTLLGAGPSATQIVGADTTVIVVELAAGGPLRIAGIGFSGSGGDTQLETTMINLHGTLDQVRIDHVSFTDIRWHAVTIGLWDVIPVTPRVLFDHIDYRSSLTTDFSRFLKLLGQNDAWKSPDDYGTEAFVFIEDSTFLWTGDAGVNSGVTDTEHGSRLVVRYSTIDGGGIQVHDTGSTPASRGARVTEVYENDFDCTITGCDDIPGIGVRGGGWLIHHNRFAGLYWTPAFAQVYRATVEGGFLGVMCDGTAISVCDTPNLYHCSGGDHRACGYLGDFACNGMGDCVLEAASAAECPGAFIPSVDDVDGVPGDMGYPCMNQTGWGREYYDGTTFREEPSPVYWWSNTVEGSAADAPFEGAGASAWFARDRDYCSHDPSSACGTREAWSYTPYPHPHPWQARGCAY